MLSPFSPLTLFVIIGSPLLLYLTEYDEFDAFNGAKVLLDVIENHDKNHVQYVKRANEYLDSLLPTNPVNIYLYEKELKRLFE